MSADTFDLGRWPALEKNARVRTWFTIQANLGLAPRTLLAYARGLADFLLMCDDLGVDHVVARKPVVAEWVHRMSQRPSGRGSRVVALDSGCGLANATIQQRLTSVRLFYDFLIEEGERTTNPVGRGRYTPGKG